MSNLKTTFAGLELKNPIIAASCNRTNSVEHIQELANAGVGAVVLKSLFEENIVKQTDSYIDDSTYTEGLDYLQLYLKNHALDEYITLIKGCKAACDIPIIASINCWNIGEWVEFAKLIEEAGADAFELNIMSVQTEIDYVYGSYEQTHVDILREIRKAVKLPIIIKLGSNLTNPVSLTYRLKAEGANAVVMFNRMYQTDIDVYKLDYVPGHVLSSEQDLALPLRWIGIASGKVNSIDYALSGGVHSPEDIVKAILVGASAVEICSVLYQEGNAWIGKALEMIGEWQDKLSYLGIEEYKGKFSCKHQEGEERFNRTQFLKYFESFQK